MTCYTLAGGRWPEMDRATDYREKPLATSFLFSRSLRLYRSDLLGSTFYLTFGQKSTTRSKIVCHAISAQCPEIPGQMPHNRMNINGSRHTLGSPLPDPSQDCHWSSLWPVSSAKTQSHFCPCGGRLSIAAIAPDCCEWSVAINLESGRT